MKFHRHCWSSESDCPCTLTCCLTDICCEINYRYSPAWLPFVAWIQQYITYYDGLPKGKGFLGKQSLFDRWPKIEDWGKCWVAYYKPHCPKNYLNLLLQHVLFVSGPEIFEQKPDIFRCIHSSPDKLVFYPEIIFDTFLEFSDNSNRTRTTHIKETYPGELIKKNTRTLIIMRMMSLLTKCLRILHGNCTTGITVSCGSFRLMRFSASNIFLLLQKEINSYIPFLQQSSGLWGRPAINFFLI